MIGWNEICRNGYEGKAVGTYELLCVTARERGWRVCLTASTGGPRVQGRAQLRRLVVFIQGKPLAVDIGKRSLNGAADRVLAELNLRGVLKP